MKTFSILPVLLPLLALAISTTACEPTLPDDLPTLIALMDRNSQTISVDATLKVRKLYGRPGLFQALREGRPGARSRAAFRLRDFRDEETEQTLMDTLAKDPEHFVRQQAAWSLEEVGTVRALSLVERATTDPDPDVARRAEEALAAIRARLERTRK